MKWASKVRASYLRYVRGEKKGLSCLLWCWLALFTPLACLWVGVRVFFRAHGLRAVSEPAVPVVSVGNLTTGGTNKTPFVAYLAQSFLAAGLKPAVLTRGYSRRNKEPQVFSGGEATRDLVGDEALLLSSRLGDVPIIVSPDRGKASHLAPELGVDISLADDGFSHLRLDRDVDIVLIDATCPFGNGHLLPWGMLREPLRNLRRAHMVVLTKVETCSPEALNALKDQLARYVGVENIFTSQLKLTGWARYQGRRLAPCDKPQGPLAAFSTIGSPSSFYRTLQAEGIQPVLVTDFGDHHILSLDEARAFEVQAQRVGAVGFVCTEKCLFNVPEGAFSKPLYVPQVAVVLDDEQGFWKALRDHLRPKLLIASNGHGEDAIAAYTARRFQEAYPEAQVYGFSLVGDGSAFRGQGIEVLSPDAPSPSGGLIKYGLGNLWRDLKGGLLGHILRQQKALARWRRSIRTTLCIGDVYLALHNLWGTGRKPLLAATAKTVHIDGHSALEGALLRRRVRHTFTRDAESAHQLREKGVDVSFEGNPIMDLALASEGPEPSWPEGKRRVLLLPGSRERAYDDAVLALRALSQVPDLAVVMVAADTIDLSLLAARCDGQMKGDELCAFGLTVKVTRGPLAKAAARADLLLGWGGTANQVCAGLGLPVVAPDERGKRVQKKLLGESEVLVHPTAHALADAVASLLDDEPRRRAMAEEGRRRMGGGGWVQAALNYTSQTLGWQRRLTVYRRLKERMIEG